MRRRRVPLVLVSLLLAALHWGCMGACDLLVPTKRLPGGYALIRLEGRRHYVTKEGVPFGGGGVLQGAVSALGWNDRYIVGSRWAMSSELRSGWMIIDNQSGAIRGPLTDAEFADAQKADASLRSIEPVHVDEAWKK